MENPPLRHLDPKRRVRSDAGGDCLSKRFFAELVLALFCLAVAPLTTDAWAQSAATPLYGANFAAENPPGFEDTAEAGWNSPADEPALLASRQNGFDFELTGTGEGNLPGFSSVERIDTPEIPGLDSFRTSASGIEPTGDQTGSDLDRYQFNDEGNQRFIVPKQPASAEPICITAEFGWKGPSDAENQIYILSGDCRLTQGKDKISGPHAVLWMRNEGVEKEASIYFERENSWEPLQIAINTPFMAAKTTDQGWYGTFRTSQTIDLHIAEPGSGQLNPDTLYRRAQALRNQAVPETNVQNIPVTSRLAVRLTDAERQAGGRFGMRRIRILSRYDRDMTIRTVPDPADSSKTRLVVNGGCTMMIEGISRDGETLSDVIDISADNAVIWAPGLQSLMNQSQEYQQQGELDLEIFLDGDIIFREGDRTVYASKMYYDVKNRVGLIRDTELVLPVPETAGGWFRIKADAVTQTGPDSLSATNAWVSTSMMGEPTYRLQSDSLTAELRSAPLYDSASGQPKIDPVTGAQETNDTGYVIAENNTVRIGSVPVFYWPWMAMDTQRQSLYLRNIRVGNDNTFGTQVRTEWDLYQILNLNTRKPDGSHWDLDLDYLSKRGFGHGTTFTYPRGGLFGCKDPMVGAASYYGICDHGTDNLGYGRRSLDIPNKYRYRANWKHRQMFDFPWSRCVSSNSLCRELSEGWVATAQAGKSSDRNYLQQYFEHEWFTESNPETSFEIKKTVNNWSLGILGSYRLDKFYTDTNWLPRADHYLMGQKIGCTPLLWYEHTSIGYGQFRTTEDPYTNQEKALFRYLDWELQPNSVSNDPRGKYSTLSQNTFAFATRNELDLPMELGPVKVTPYGLGEFAYWSQAADGSLARGYGRGGVRMNLPVWKVDSDVHSRLWYLNGMAHKMNFAMDAYYSRANKHLCETTLYNQLDDWQTQGFRRLYSATTFSNTYEPYRDSIPVRFDERYYALRQGLLGGSVASPYTEIADDLTQVRFDWLNRWQTKRGPIGSRHIIDWITFDAGFSLYPEKEQNFGQTISLTDYDFRWHVGDRFSVLSSGLFDFFDSGQKIIRVGAMTKHPGASSLYLGVDRLSGPIDSTYLNAALNYRMSEKWAMSLSNSYDLAEKHNVGQQFGITRIGESFIFTLSTNISSSKDDWGVSLNVMPVFMYSRQQFQEDVLGFGKM
ncbi:MAG: hypothetical protein IJG02_08055 [Thermoguttaceae bacterium]|nr:hypothetical protein [Thermoguttaceae bacterium]